MTRPRIPPFWTLLLLACGVTLTACTEGSTEAGEAAPSTTPAGTSLPVDASFLADPIWDDGKAEIAFYRVERSYNVYEEPESVTFDVGTYLVKQNFSRETMAKTTDGSGTAAFKAATFFEMNSGSYQYKRNWVVNARRSDLAPLKHSFSSFDWCSNLYREYAFHGDGGVTFLKRSDDYGNQERRLDIAADVFDRVVPSALVPLLVRSLTFGDEGPVPFFVLNANDGPIRARAAFIDTTTVETPAGSRSGERIRVTYDRPAPSPVAGKTAKSEVYARAMDSERTLLSLEAGDDSYRMVLVEHLRSAYWSENIWPMLDRVSERP